MSDDRTRYYKHEDYMDAKLTSEDEAKKGPGRPPKAVANKA